MDNTKPISDEGGYTTLIKATVLIVETALCVVLFWFFTYLDFDWPVWNTQMIHSVVVTAMLYFFSAYNGGTVLHKRDVRNHQVIVKSLRNVIVFAIADALVFEIGRFFHPSWKYYVFFILSLLTCSVVFRLFFKFCISKARAGNSHTKHVVLVGRGENLDALYSELTSPLTGYGVCGYFDDKVHENADPEKYPWLGRPGDVIDYLKGNPEIRGLFCALPSARRNEIVQIIRYCENNLVHFYSVPNVRNYLYNKMYLNMIGDVPYLSMHKEPLSKAENRFVKRAFDIVFSGLVLVTVFPVALIVVCIVTSITMPGPIFFWQKRNGIDGKEFTCLKFRSMKVNDEADTKQATKDDPRKTRWGNFMRRTNIDELPQFINVFLGSMSVVGPRPHMVKHTEEYSKLIDKYMVRHYVKPGITGWSQVTGFRGETKELSQMEGRVKGDIYYIEHWSIWLDIYIILKTIYNAFSGDKQAY